MDDFRVPSTVGQLGQRMVDAGHTSFLVGPGLRDLLTGISPSHFELSTDAPLSEILERFPNGVLIGKRSDTVMVPSQAGPVDVSPFRVGAHIESDLAHRDFTVNAIAYDVADRKWLDPHGGRADLERGLVRAVRCARDRIAEDPIRALRAVRLASTRGWELDPELESALGSARTALAKIPREPIRRELIAILLSAGAVRALEQLDQSQLTSELAPGLAPGSGAVLERLPGDLELRLAGWLRGARARRVLQRLRFSHPTIDRVERLLRYHQTDGQINAMSAAATARFARRIGVHNLIALIALRESEIKTVGDESEAARNALQTLREALTLLRDSERTQSGRNRLAISGSDVMDCLGCEAGPRVGRAIAYLAKQIRLNPARNSPDALRKLLRDWVDESGDTPRSQS
jgi:tRNA nucleotidyltransferase/poly(A) polymerase